MMIPSPLYIDPSVMTYAIQAIAGAVIAIGAVVAVVWRKAKKKVAETLKIEERSNKEVEEEIRVVDDDDDDDADAKTDAAE